MNDVQEVKRITSGYWIVYEMSLDYGGPEEGGWWTDRGEAIAIMPGMREAIIEETWSEEDGYDRVIVKYLEDEPQYVKDMCKWLVESGSGKFDDRYRSAYPRGSSYQLHWNEKKVMHFSSQGGYE